jgi:hypothetical protein
MKNTNTNTDTVDAKLIRKHLTTRGVEL